MAEPHYGRLLLQALRALRAYASPTPPGAEVARSTLKDIAYALTPDGDRISKAPWTDDQVESLNGYQQCGRYHPFTFGDGDEKVDLIATNDGWVAYEGGPVVQAWAHTWMADWSWHIPPALPI